MIYLDNASTTKISRSVYRKMSSFYKLYGNYSSAHYMGRKVRLILESYKEKISVLLKCKSSEIIWTSSATESNNLSIFGFTNGKKNIVIVTYNVEHPSILNAYKSLKNKKNIKVVTLKVDKNCNIIKSKIKRLFETESIYMLSVSYVNNEVGTINDIEFLSKICLKNGTIFHVDASQAFGRVKINLRRTYISSLTISGHKIHGPKGISILYLNNDFKEMINPIMFGGSQQFGLRPGTIPTLQVIGISEAIIRTYSNKKQDCLKIFGLYKYMNSCFKSLFSSSYDCIISNKKIPHITNIKVSGLESDIVIANKKGIIVSNSSACESGFYNGSRVISEIRSNDQGLSEYFRVSFSKYNKICDVHKLAKLIESLYFKLV
ncbi:cysteine desulfurase family protein [Candidatus Vidania fulgoroideorum]